MLGYEISGSWLMIASSLVSHRYPRFFSTDTESKLVWKPGAYRTSWIRSGTFWPVIGLIPSIPISPRPWLRVEVSPTCTVLSEGVNFTNKLRS